MRLRVVIGTAAAIACLGLCLSAQLSAEIATPVHAAVVPEQFLHEKLSAWQKRLKLEAWKISILVMRRNDLNSKTLGGIRWDKNKHTATIAVMDPADYTVPMDEMLADMEFTVVHELVHLELASLRHSEATRGNEEFAVNRIAEALLGR